MARLWLAFVLLATGNAFPVEFRLDYMARLAGDLFNDYDKELLPQFNKSEPIDLQFGVQAVSLDLNEKGELDAALWLVFAWKDKRLAWNPEEYHNLTDFRMPASKVWKPDFELYNSNSYGPGSFSHSLKESTAKVLIYNDGEVLWLPPVSAKVFCPEQEFAAWPWGEYDCTMKFGSWTNNGQQINLKKYQDLNFIGTEPVGKTSSPFFFTKNSFTEEILENKTYDCCPDQVYQSANYRFKVQRKYRLTAEGRESNPILVEAHGGSFY